MSRYVISFTLGALVVGSFFFVHWMNYDPPIGTSYNPVFHHTTLGIIDWSLISVFSLFAVLSVWGIVGVALSKVKQKAEELASQDVVISRRSWHYKLNTWANFGNKPPETTSECEYWARLAHGLPSAPLGYVFIITIKILIAVIGWLFSARVDVTHIHIVDMDELFKEGHQPIGPIVGILMLMGGLATILLLSGAGQALLDASWMSVGKWAGISIAGVVGAVALIISIFLIGQLILYNIAQPLFSFAVARIMRVCRQAQFVD